MAGALLRAAVAHYKTTSILMLWSWKLNFIPFDFYRAIFVLTFCHVGKTWWLIVEPDSIDQRVDNRFSNTIFSIFQCFHPILISVYTIRKNSTKMDMPKHYRMAQAIWIGRIRFISLWWTIWPVIKPKDERFFFFPSSKWSVSVTLSITWMVLNKKPITSLLSLYLFDWLWWNMWTKGK